MYRQNTGLHQTILKEIETAYPGRIAKQKVRLTIQLAEAAKEGLSIFEYAPASIGALDMYALCFELFRITPEQVKALAQARLNTPLDATNSTLPLVSQAEIFSPAVEDDVAI
jgi:hypothetical protein